MKKMILAIAVAAGICPTVAVAQDDRVVRPYVGVLGGREDYDSENSRSGVPPVRGNRGGFVELTAGVDFHLPQVSNSIVLGIEGNVAKGVKGTIDWQYAAFGRVGVKAGNDSMIFGKGGWRWTQFDVANARTFDGLAWGLGVDWSTQDMGGTPDGRLANVKVRFQAETFDDFRSIRPSAGVILAF